MMRIISFLREEKVQLVTGFLLLLVAFFFETWRIRIGELSVAPILYTVSYVVVGGGVLFGAGRLLFRSFDLFNELTLMSIATIGAFAIGKYPEAVSVMLFYRLGEWIQGIAVRKSRRSIESLLDRRPREVSVWADGKVTKRDPKVVTIGQLISLSPGEQVAIDGNLENESATFQTSALTGESIPVTYQKGQSVLAGMVNLEQEVKIRTTRLFQNSAMSRILEMVQSAVKQKAPTELFMRRFARWYTPFVFLAAFLVLALPFFLVDAYVFRDWLYRSLIFLVISCPCALVISIPLGYFGGIGLGSRRGILFKGSITIDQIAGVNAVAFDKTGTLTTGQFQVIEARAISADKEKWIAASVSLLSKSKHPISQAVTEWGKGKKLLENITGVEEKAGHGLIGRINEDRIAVGNSNLLDFLSIPFPTKEVDLGKWPGRSLLYVCINGQCVGFFALADSLKTDAKAAIEGLRSFGISKILLVSGDRKATAEEVGRELEIQEVFAPLLPDEKVNKIKEVKDKGFRVAFVGDGFNDAPVLAASDVGIAMGGSGSDLAVEAADVVLQNNRPSSVLEAIRVGRLTRNTVWQNITLAFGVKLLFIFLGVFGVATLWEAVFADVGVALLAIGNAYRIQYRKINF